MSAFTLDELAREAQREVQYRRWVYSKQIEEGRMAQSIAERKIAMMEAIAERLQAEAEQASPQGRLW